MTGQGSNIVPINTQEQAVSASKATGLGVDQVHPFVVAYRGEGKERLYVNTAGKRFKMDQRFGPGGYEIRIGPPEEAAYNTLRKMWGIKADTACIIIKAQIYVDDKLKYEDYGTATIENCVQFQKRGIEVATTRAINRAMGQGTAQGFSDQATYKHSLSGYKLGFVQECQKYKRALGNDRYYGVLKTYGVQHSNDPTLLGDPMIMQMVLDDLEGSGQNMGDGVLVEQGKDDLYGPEGVSFSEQTEPEEAQGDTADQEKVEFEQTTLFQPDPNEITEKERMDFLYEVGEAVVSGRVKDTAADKAQTMLSDGKLTRDYVVKKTEQFKKEREDGEEKHTP